MGIEYNIDIGGDLGEAFRKDIEAGLGPHFDGVVQRLSHPEEGQPVYQGDAAVIVAWEFDGTVRKAEDKHDVITFHGVGPLNSGTEVHFWGVHIFDEKLQVLRIVDEQPLREQLGIVDAGRPLVERHGGKAAD